MANKKKTTLEVIDKSPVVLGQRSKIDFDFNLRGLSWTDKQKDLLSLIADKKTKCVFIAGPAGCAKTSTSVYAALESLRQKKVSDIVFLRTAVESADSKIGFLPGEASNKLQNYMIPFLDKMDEFLEAGVIKRLQNDERFHAAAVNFARGLHWAGKIVICDECQNATFKELTTIITRMGQFSKLLLLGDPNQSDLPENKKDGFNRMMNLFDDSESEENGIFIRRFTNDDILRSDFVKFVVKRLENGKNNDK